MIILRKTLQFVDNSQDCGNLIIALVILFTQSNALCYNRFYLLLLFLEWFGPPPVCAAIAAALPIVSLKCNDVWEKFLK